MVPKDHDAQREIAAIGAGLKLLVSFDPEARARIAWYWQRFHLDQCEAEAKARSAAFKAEQEAARAAVQT